MKSEKSVPSKAHKIKVKPEESALSKVLSKSSITCFFCDLIMPLGTDQNLYLQHLETCDARPVLEAHHLQKTLKTEEEVMEPVKSHQGRSNTEEAEKILLHGAWMWKKVWTQ